LQKYEQHRSQKYRPQWENESIFKGWLRKSENSEYKGHCKACNDDLIAEISTLKRHASSEKHKINASVIKKCKLMNEVFTSKHLDSPHEKLVKSAEIVLSGFFAENNVAFRIVDLLIPVLKNIFPDSKILADVKLGRTKLTNILKNVISKSEKNDLAATLRSIPYSVLSDESTDVSTSKMMTILVRYFNCKTVKIETSMWCLAEIYTEVPSADNCGKITDKKAEVIAIADVDPNVDPNELVIEEEKVDDGQFPVLRGATAKDLYDALKKSFTDFQIPAKNLIGFGSDGANVMFGDENSVVSRMQKEYPGDVSVLS